MATHRTATPQTAEGKAIKSARTRSLTAAKKSLALIEEAVAKHKAGLEAGTIPDTAFTVFALKYEGQRTLLEALGKLADGEPIEPEPEPEAPAPARQEDAVAENQRREDIAALIEVLGILAPELQPVEGYPLYRLREYAIPGGTRAEYPAGVNGGQQVTEPLEGDGTGEVAAALAAGEDEPPF